MTEQTCKNGYDSRCGFSDLGEDDSVSSLNRQANTAMKNRIKNKLYTTQPKMSHVLKYQKKIPHVVGHFIMKNGSACALGIIHLKAGGSKYDKQPDWDLIDQQYQLTPEETHRQVQCPVCVNYKFGGKGYDNIMARLFHLNDWHGWSTWKIGTWLEQYNL